jgi:hypothetical protein
MYRRRWPIDLICKRDRSCCGLRPAARAICDNLRLYVTHVTETAGNRCDLKSRQCVDLLVSGILGSSLETEELKSVEAIGRGSFLQNLGHVQQKTSGGMARP